MINKKTVLNYILIAAFALMISSFFVPIASFSTLDYSKGIGNENPEVYWEEENNWIYSHLNAYSYENDEKVNFYSKTRILILYFYSGDYSDYLSNVDDYTRRDYSLSRAVLELITIMFGLLSIVLLSYFSLKSFKNVGVGKSKYHLNVGIMVLGILILFLFNIYYIYYFTDTKNVGYINFVRLNYGFYLLIASAVLFFIAYFIESYFIRSKNEDGKSEKLS
jgi:hypothetical protein